MRGHHKHFFVTFSESWSSYFSFFDLSHVPDSIDLFDVEVIKFF